ncbi:hypothetical protein [Peptoniphilus raoultii]|uniref:hypothetical protein n=1 Tax=Peptoniphilus raoultii TaxID=1776387 RepID=UPI0008DA5D0D|nr:hypothetical protein [Peptoniphilus raoultii]
MKIETFDEVYGEYLENILGQYRFYNSISDLETFYEIPDWIKENGYYQGAVIRFYDLYNNKVYTPFEKEKNVTYTYAKFKNDFFYFLKVDFNKNVIDLIKYYPEKSLESIIQLSLDNINLYNLALEDGYEFHICSSDDKFISYYPRKFELNLKEDQSVIYIDKDKIYINEWVEEGIVKDTFTNDYKYYDKLLALDMNGNILWERKGNLSQYPNGKWYLT